MGNAYGVNTPPLHYERSLWASGYLAVAGVDEVGRGSWAGPVVAAAVILPPIPSCGVEKLLGVRDSKQLSATQRLQQFELIKLVAVDIGIGSSSHHVVDREGIGPANQHAMMRAVAALSLAPHALLLDHFRLDASLLPQVAVTKGDSMSLSIAAASIVAKVVRDRWMEKCDRRFPEYGFCKHKGYGTAAHREAITALGPCALHRRSFAPIAFRSL